MGYKDKNQQREYQRQWIAKRRKEWFEKNGPCVKCGSWDRLELDHIIESDKWTHRIWSCSEERRNEEIAKCQVLCYECHLNKTRKFLSVDSDHGDIHKYWQGCRCELCRSANREYEFLRKKINCLIIKSVYNA